MILNITTLLEYNFIAFGNRSELNIWASDFIITNNNFNVLIDIVVIGY